MKRSFNLSAAQTAMLSGMGGLITASACLLPSLLYTRFQCSGLLFRAQLLLPALLVGLPLWVLAGKRLRRGIKEGRWRQQEVDSLRALAESRLSTVLTWALLLAFCISLLLPERLREVGWCFMVLSQCLTTLRNAIRRKPSNADLQPTWSDLSPIHSEHWASTEPNLTL